MKKIFIALFLATLVLAGWWISENWDPNWNYERSRPSFVVRVEGRDRIVHANRVERDTVKVYDSIIVEPLNPDNLNEDWTMSAKGQPAIVIKKLLVKGEHRSVSLHDSFPRGITKRSPAPGPAQ